MRRQNALSARTWYDDTAIGAPLTADAAALGAHLDVAIIGGGLAGLVLALRLAESGAKVGLLERRTLGSGASGRNGGFCSAGWAASDAQIRRVAGEDAAARLAGLASEGVAWMRRRAETAGYEAAQMQAGVLGVALAGPPPRRVDPGERLLGRDDLGAILSSPRYRHGVLSTADFHFHPLNFLRLLAGDAMAAGATLCEHAPLVGWERRTGGFALVLGGGRRVSARRLVFATGGYGGAENRRLRARLLSIRTYIGVSAPMARLLDAHIATRWAVGDSRRAGNYYRRLRDGRLLWGMGITAFGTLGTDRIKAMVMKDIAAVYPELAARMRAAGTTLAYGWAGNMAYARHFLPYVGEAAPGVFALTGFGGHGMNTAPVAAMALADHLSGRDAAALRPFAAIPMRRSFGLAGRLGAEAVYRALRLADWMAERRA